MKTFKLHYFDFDGGRGEPIRIALDKAGIDFEDHRISFAEFGELRPALRFGVLPEIEIDGVTVTQSNGISRYIGKMADLYPADDLQALYCDEALGAVEDMFHAITSTFGLEGEALREARERLVEGRLKTYLRGVGELLARGGGEYFADKRLTVADLKVWSIIRWLHSGALDYIPGDILERTVPALAEHEQRIENHPVVRAYYASSS